MKSNFIKILVLIIGCQLFMSCAKEDKAVDDRKVTITATDKMSADELVTSAEQLVGPTTFMLAYRLSKMALEKDPENLKAQFYTKLLSRFEAFRGFYVRITPLLEPEQKARVENDIKNLPTSPLKTFLTDAQGGAQLRNSDDVQDMYAQYLTAVADFYQLLKDKEDSKFEIYLNPLIFEQEIRSELSKNCALVEDNASKLVVECQSVNIAVKKLNIADMIALRQIAAGEMLYGMFLNSYSLSGASEYAKAHKNEKQTTQQVVTGLFQNGKFGLLKSSNLLPKMIKIGSDSSAAISWAMQYQESVCPANTTADKRPGYLFKKGLCVTDKNAADKAVQLIQLALKGAMPVEVRSNQLSSVNVDVFAWSRNPIQDLRSIEPTSYSADGRVQSFKDNSLGGIFVDRNVNDLLK